MLTPLLFGLLSCATLVDDETADETKKPEGFTFEREITIPGTPVKHQASTGTCWAFATTSFLEAELLRTGRGELDLSEMFVVRHIYPRKAKRYVRMHGAERLTSGGLSPDVLRVWRDVGLVPEAAYPGTLEGETRHNHGELDALLTAMLGVIVANRGGFVSSAWEEAVEGVLDAYLGEIPAQFTHDGETFTPRTFADSLGLNPDDYLQFTSYTHHPFYREVSLEVPDNWARHLSWNVPLDELMAIGEHALENGFSVAWGGDSSEKSFKYDKGVAFLPAQPWAERSKKEQEKVGEAPEPELEVTQGVRQRHFDRYESTDDHAMHVVGTARDQNGTRYWVIKNSWGTLNSEYDGFLHLSEAYSRSKMLSMLVHRDAVPAKILEKLGRNR